MEQLQEVFAEGRVALWVVRVTVGFRDHLIRDADRPFHQEAFNETQDRVVIDLSLLETCLDDVNIEVLHLQRLSRAVGLLRC